VKNLGFAKVAVAVTAVAALGAYVNPTQASPLSSAVVSSAVIDPTTSPIKHVVIIYQENHTFDDVLGQLCQTRTTPCNGYTGPVTFADGITASNITQPDIVPGLAHGLPAQTKALANEWDKIIGCSSSPYRCVSHVRPADIPNVAALANQFAVSDRTFAAFPTASYGSHIQITAGKLDGFNSGVNPVASKTGAIPGPGWGCPSRKDELWRNGTFVPSCIPNRRGHGPYRPSPVPYVPTIMERTEEAGLTWHIYQGNSTTEPTDDIWSICTYFYWCYKNRFGLTHNSSTGSFITAAGSTTPLPSVSLIMPVMPVSQHNDTSMTQGDNYIGNIVSAVENGPQWNSTAIFITWDDCGCFYDHVKPPAGRSFRNPMIIVSPWAKSGYTDSTTALQPYSMLTFIQHNFGLASLSSQVAGSYDYADSFDFSQVPVAAVTMTHTVITKAERARLARLAPLIKDAVT
jgi:phospholipase C